MSEVDAGFSDANGRWQGCEGNRQLRQRKAPPPGSHTAAAGAGLSNLPFLAPAEQAREEPRLLHRLDGSVHHVTQTRVAMRTRDGPAIRATAPLRATR